MVNVRTVKNALKLNENVMQNYFSICISEVNPDVGNSRSRDFPMISGLKFPIGKFFYFPNFGKFYAGHKWKCSLIDKNLSKLSELISQ